MRLRISEVNFTVDENWIFKLSDGSVDYYVLDEDGYKSKGLRSPISRPELDCWDVGHSILCESADIDGLNIITRIK